MNSVYWMTGVIISYWRIIENKIEKVKSHLKKAIECQTRELDLILWANVPSLCRKVITVSVRLFFLLSFYIVLQKFRGRSKYCGLEYLGIDKH